MDWWLWPIVIVAGLFAVVVLRGAPYVPTKKRLIVRAFSEIYPLSSKDTLVDIGCGDGVVLRAAASHGARAIGYELNPILALVAWLFSRHDHISVKLADFWLVTLPPETTIVYTFGESRDIKKMYKKVEQTARLHKKDLYFMSFGFPVPGQKHVKHDQSFYLYKITLSR